MVPGTKHITSTIIADGALQDVSMYDDSSCTNLVAADDDIGAYVEVSKGQIRL